MRSPYVFVGGRLEEEGSGADVCRLPDGKKWMDARDKNVEQVLSELRDRNRITSINSAASSPAVPGSSDWR